MDRGKTKTEIKKNSASWQTLQCKYPARRGQEEVLYVNIWHLCQVGDKTHKVELARYAKSDKKRSFGCQHRASGRDSGLLVQPTGHLPRSTLWQKLQIAPKEKQSASQHHAPWRLPTVDMRGQQKKCNIAPAPSTPCRSLQAVHWLVAKTTEIMAK